MLKKLKLIRKGNYKNTRQYLQLGGRDQDKVMERYRKLGFVKNEDDERKLHQFFSPNRVPKGLKKLETRICILLQPLRGLDFILRSRYRYAGPLAAVPRSLCRTSTNLGIVPPEMARSPARPGQILAGVQKFLVSLALLNDACLTKGKRPRKPKFDYRAESFPADIVRALDEGNIGTATAVWELWKWKSVRVRKPDWVK